MEDKVSENWPELSFPEVEASLLVREYENAKVILEYGSGGSTVLASRMSGKLVFSVESDRQWAVNLQAHIDKLALPSPAMVHYVDIGPTGEWGRPLNTEKWSRFFRYPLDIWSLPFFRHPDVVLVDGRFRPACLAAVGMLCTRPVRVLFDDYIERTLYHGVEKFFPIVEKVGRMAIFEVKPGRISSQDFPQIIGFFAHATYHGDPINYGTPNESS